MASSYHYHASKGAVTQVPIMLKETISLQNPLPGISAHQTENDTSLDVSFFGSKRQGICVTLWLSGFWADDI